MSISKEMYHYQQYNLNANQIVCSQHIDNKYIKRYIQKNGFTGKCEYCGKTLKVIELSEVLKLIVIGINYLFDDPNNTKFVNHDAEYNLDGDNFLFYDIWYEDYLGLSINNDRLSEEIYSCLNNDQLYCHKDEYGSHQEYLENIWENFKKVVKYNARFVFYYKKIFAPRFEVDPVTILDQVQHYIIKFNLFITIPKNKKLYRCRQYANKAEMKSKKDLASTPIEFAKVNGRMNPVGISMFYCSMEKELTIKEVVDYTDFKRPFYSIGFFKNIKEIKLIDLTKIPDMPSIFDDKKNKDIEVLGFMKGFIDDITAPISTNDSMIEYIPTQIVTEYIRYNPQLNVDGIIYPSSKSKTSHNIVLFYNHDDSMQKLEFQKGKIVTLNI